MRKPDFLRDRWLLVLGSLLAIGMAVLVLWLDSLQAGTPLTASALGYAWLLAFLTLALCLVVDGLRQRPFRRELASLQKQTDLTAAFKLQSGVTSEQRLMQAVLQTQYRRYQAEIDAYKQAQELQNHFQNRWVHQMKTPLAVLDLLLQQWEADQLQEQELISSLREVRDKLSNGLELMLHNARLSQFELDFVIHRIDVVEAARQAINAKKSAFIRSGIYPKLQAPDGPVWVETDAKWLHFVFSQLLVNAIKYSCLSDTADKTVIVTVEESAAQCRVSVSDGGIGIPAQDLGRVWQPFFTGENGRRYPEATGMGLYLTKEICDHLGHEVALESQVGVGTTVSLHFRAQDHLHRLVRGTS